MKNFQRTIVLLLVANLSLPWPMRLDAQTAGQSPASPQVPATKQAPATAPPAASMFKPEEIEQMVAPIALYPDSLVSQILMASTYPLEVVEAERWTKQNKNLKGDPLTTALEQKSWDPSVKSLVQFPQVLSMMSEKLEMTQRLGDAVLAQQKDVLDAIQRLRAKAQAAGNLKTTQEQKVIVEQAPAQTTTIIKIEPANPQVVYVPTYNPTVVYGAWPYPAYPPYYYYPPGYVAGTAFAFATGVALGAAWGYAWGGCNWGHGDVDVDINRNTTFNQNINRESHRTNVNQSGRGNWQHDPSHRKGVSYRDNNTAQKYNKGTNAQAAQAREAYRGRSESGRQDLARATNDGGGAANRGTGDRGAGSGERREAASSNVANRSDAGRSSEGTKQADAFQGLGGGGGDVRSASSRGASSRASSGGHSGGGGGARAGGGGGRGGRR